MCPQVSDRSGLPQEQSGEDADDFQENQAQADRILLLQTAAATWAAMAGANERVIQWVQQLNTKSSVILLTFPMPCDLGVCDINQLTWECGVLRRWNQQVILILAVLQN